MSRQPLIRTNEFIYHVTSRANNREWFNLPMAEVWQICLDQLEAAFVRAPFELNAFVLMNNHYHMLVKTPMCNLDEVMFEFNRKFSQILRKRTDRINKMFGGRYHWSLIEHENYLFNVFKYVFQNPLRQNLSVRCQDYPYSTLSYLVAGKQFSIPLQTPIDFCDENFLSWANRKFNETQRDCLKRGLKHFQFELTGVGPSKIPVLDAMV